MEFPGIQSQPEGRWAKHHLNLLLGEIGEYLGGHPYSLSFEDDLKAGEHIVKLELKPLRDRVGLTSGTLFRVSAALSITWQLRLPVVRAELPTTRLLPDHWS